MGRNQSIHASQLLQDSFIRRFASALIGGVINPIAFVLTYTVAGFLRPGYSPIHQAISDLGVGSNGSLLDTLAVISGLLLIAFVVGFALSMRRVLSLGWRLC